MTARSNARWINASSLQRHFHPAQNFVSRCTVAFQFVMREIHIRQIVVTKVDEYTLFGIDGEFACDPLFRVKLRASRLNA